MVEEVRRLPVGFLERVIECRAYAQAKRLYDSATTKEQMDAIRGRQLIDQVQEIVFGLVQDAQQHG